VSIKGDRCRLWAFAGRRVLSNQQEHVQWRVLCRFRRVAAGSQGSCAGQVVGSATAIAQQIVVAVVDWPPAQTRLGAG
jgi:hypothetical protein